MLTRDQLELFHTNGYLIMRGVIGGRELELLREAVDRVQLAGEERRGEQHRYAPGPHGTQVYWRSERMWERDAIFRSVTVHPGLLENIGQCVGQAFYPWNDSLVVKLAQSGAAVPWHQDPPYRNPDRETTYPVPNFTTDIYLDHSGTDNGCVYAIPGRHLVGHVEIHGGSEEAYFQRPDAVPIEMEAGDVLFHCLSTPHGSRANLGESQRRIFYIHYLAEEVYQDCYSRESWAAEKPGWSEQRRAGIEEMVARRVDLGLESPAGRETLRFGSDGIEFVGSPITPRRHWGDLAAAIAPERREALKRLADV